jgi:LPXTG-site transpeptidase (sortase) family protein
MSNLFVSNRTNLSVFLRFLFVFILAGLPLAGSPSQGAVAAPGEPAQVEPAPVFVATPTLTLGVPSTVPLGSEFTFTATFTNTGAPPDEVGYGPFIDLVFPATGMDGVYPGTDPDDLYDGVTFVGASFMGIDIDPSQIFVQTFPDDGGGIGCVQHPIAVRPANDPPPPANPNLPRYYQVCGNAGDQFVTIILPFGSFVPSQPPATVTITAQMSELADLDAPLTISGQAGFQFGYTPLNDFCCSPFDATIPVQPGGIYDSSTFPGQSVAPTLMSLSKTYIGPENETATGPNFPRQYVITVDIADGQPVSGLTITDFLPDNIQYVSLDSVTVGGAPAGYNATEPSTTIPGGTLIVELDDPDPVIGGDTVEVTFTFYVDRLDMASDIVLDPVTGAFVESDNTARADGTWDTPLDPRDVTDPLPTTSAVCPSPCVVIEDQSLAIQKGVANITDSQNNPGDVLEYTLSFQISDFFGFQSLVISDVFTDGQRFDSSFVPRLTVNGNGYTLSAAAMNAANYDVACDYTLNTFPGDDGSECTINNSAAPNTGGTTLTFRISDEIITRGQNGQLLGGCVDPTDANNPPVCSGAGSYNDGPTTGTLTFRTVIQDQFSDLHLASGNSGDSSVDHGDVLANEVDMSGTVLNIAAAPVGGLFSAQPGNPRPEDGSGAGVSIAFGELQKRIYAVNGSTSIPTFLAPGDVVTYRLTYTQPSSDFEETTFTDYLPLPVFDATELTTLNNTICGIPSAGLICLGPADNYHNLNSRGEDLAPADPPGNLVVTPTFTTNGPANRLTITYAAYDSIYNISSTIDILFSVTVTEDPFADGLFLTNQVTSSEGTTNAGNQFLDEIVQIRLGQPVLRIGKTAVSSDHVPDTDIIFTPDQTIYGQFEEPGNAGAPFSGTIATNDLSTDPSDPGAAFDLFNGVMEGVDNDDLIKYAIIIENKGRSPNGAYDIAIQDILPPGMAIPTGTPGLNLQIYRGDGGSPISFTSLADPADCTNVWPGDPCGPNGTAGDADDIFGAGIMINDPVSGPDAGIGVCQVHDEDNGRNIIVITYDLLLADADTAGKSIINTASLIGYSGTEGGPNYLPDPLDDDAEIITNRLPGLTKTLVGTEFDAVGNNAANQAVIGEIITYEVEVKFFELKTPDAVLVDTLDPGLAFVDLVSVVNSDPVALTIPTMTFDGSGDCTNCIAGTAVGSNPLINNNGGTITFDFGDVVNNTDTNNLQAETITIRYRAVVLNVVGNQSGTQLNNAATMTWTNASEPTDGSQTVSAENVTVVEPVVTITKAADALFALDAGDPLEYTFVITGGTTVAYDLTFSDPLPEYFIPDNSASFNVVSSLLGVATNADFEIVGAAAPYTFQTVAGADIDLQPGETITITINGSISYATPANASLENTATVYWTSLDGDITDRSTYNPVSDERTGNDGVGGALDDYAAESTIVTSVTNPLVLVKSIVATSEAHTSGTDVAIGEIVRFRLIVEIPEGTNIDLKFQDQLPLGLTFLNDGTAMAAFVSNSGTDCSIPPAPTINSSTLGTAPWVCGASGNVTPTYVLPDGAVSNTSSINMDDYSSGTWVYFKFGDLANNDNDVDNEYVVVEFNALVDNSVAGNNNNGDVLTNVFQAYVDNNQSGDPSDPVTVTVVEPNISIDKTASPNSNIDAGDVVTYTVTLTNNGPADAFEMVVSDDMSALPFDNMTHSSTTFGGACESPGVPSVVVSGGNQIEVSVPRVSPGCVVTIVYTARATNDVISSRNGSNLTTYTNTADVTYTSLPGDNGTGDATPGDPGDEDGERNDDGGVNDYSDSDTADVTIKRATRTKSIVATSEAHTSDTQTGNSEATARPVAIGEIVRYRLVFSLPEGTTPNFRMRDRFSTSGQQFIPGSERYLFVSSNANGVSSSTFDPGTGAANVIPGLNCANLVGNYSLAQAASTVSIASSLVNCAFADNNVSSSATTNNDTYGTDVYFKFGDVLNADFEGHANPDTSLEFVIVEFDALVLNVAANQDPTALNDTLQGYYSPTGTTTVVTMEGGIIRYTVVREPLINNLDKSVTSSGPYEAGSTVSYQLTYSNTGSTDAFDVQILDSLNSTYFNLTLASVVTDVSNAQCAAVSPTVTNASLGNTVDVTVSRVPVGCQVIITYSATLTTAVNPDVTYDNTADLTYTSLPGTGTDPNPTLSSTPGGSGAQNGERDGSNTPAHNDYNDTDDAQITIQAIQPVKSIVATSEAHTSEAGDGSNDSDQVRLVTVGEILRYRLVIQIPEGTSNDLIIEDQLTTGILPIFDATMEMTALNFSAGNFDSLDFSTALEAANGATVDLHNGTDFVFTTGNGYSFDLVDYDSGTNLLTFNLGDIVNLDLNDADAEFIQIDFNVLVTNTAGVEMGDILANTFRVQNNGGDWAISNTVYAEVVEPQLEVDKSADDTVWEYGQTPVTYTIDVAHTGNSTTDAFDIVVTDTIPAGLTYNTASITAPAGWVADDSATPDLTWTCSSPACSMPLAGGAVSLTYTVTVNDQFTTPHLMGDDTAENTADITWTSLPGTGTTGNPTGSDIPGDSGDEDGERDGSETPTHNDYTDSDTETGGLVEYYSLGNRVWFDTDNDGTMDAGEQPVPGVLVQLYDAADLTTVLASEVTNADGFYLFDYLVPGDYVVAVAADNFDTLGTYNALVGYWSSGTTRAANGNISEATAPNPDTDATDADDNGELNLFAVELPGAVAARAVTLGPMGLTEPTGEVAAQLDPVVGQGAQPDGRANMTVDFGFYRVEIGNLVYRDENVNGTYDSGTDTLLENVTVELLSGNGLTVLATTTTNALGEYRFSGLPEGDYIVRVTTPDDHVSTIDTFDVDDNADPDENTDDNDNGIGIGPATVVNVQSGVLTMTAGQGTGGSAGAANNVVTQNSGTTYDPTLDFGFTYAYALGNRVWFDTNNDSQIGFGTEVGVDGVTVELYAASDLTTLLATDTTANGGYYLFDYLTAGDYVVVIPASNFAASAVLEGYWSSATYRDTSAPYDILETAAPDPDDDVDSDDNGTLQNSGVFSDAVVSLPVTLGPGIASEPAGETDLDGGSQGDQPNTRANMTVDFGFYKVSVGNLVWADADKDGEYDSGEPLLQGVTVNLYAQDGTTLVATTTTDINGEYTFDGLPEGTYVISVIAPAGTFSTIDSFDQDDSDDPNENTDDNDNGVGLGGGEVFSNPVTLTPGDDGAQNENDVDDGTGTTYNPTLDFGFTPVYSLGNRVWYDTNNNRAIDFANELGINGVRVQLFDTSGNEIEVGLDGILGTADDASGGMLTDNGGYYLFNGLEAGEYVVVLPASNFAGGAVLEGYWSSGTTRNNDASLTEISAPDPDNDVDSDDNGTFQTGGTFAGAVVSLPVTLGPTFNEPLNESDLSGNQQGQPDAQANMTVDFGFYTIRLGNQVWNDLDNNGLLDGAEAGINAVTVELWSADGLTLLATTTTQTAGADDGVYTFTGLPQGNYIVRLPEGNFLTTGVLRDFYSSTGGAGSPYEPAPNPDVNLTDSDDNGSEAGTLGFPGGYIQSGIFALTPAAEQSLDHSLGLTTEFRVDFGVFNSPQVDLAVTKDDEQTYYLAGGTLVYEIVVTNNGPADVTDALVSDPIPAQIASWSWACSDQSGGASECTPYAGTGDFTDMVDLPQGGSITYTVTATIASDAVGTLTNTVTVAPPSGYTDTNDTNDEDSDVNQPASLTVTKDDGRTVVAPGSVITYTIELTNNGAVDLDSITVEDTLPADVTYQSAVPAPDLVSGGVVTWENISLASGENTFFSVTVQVVPEPVGSSLTNTVTANHTDTGLTDSDDDTDLVAINNGKLILDTNEPTTATPSVAIGEIVTYQISIDIPALGTLTNLQALDVLDFGLAFVRCVNIDPGSLTTTLAGGFADACNDPANPVVMAEAPGNPGLEHQGRRVLFNFGDVANPDATDARLIVEYEVVVLNIMANQDGVGDLNNSALWTWDGGSLASEAPPLEIVEPDMAILKDASPTVAPYGATINFTLDIAHTIDSTADAFDVVVTDILPPGLAFVPGSVSTTGLPPTSIDYDAPGTTLTFTWDHFPLGETAMLSFQLTFIGPAPVTNTADLAWTSLPIDPGLDGEPVQQSDYNDYSTERWYDPPDTAGVNTYGASSSVSITIPALPATGFAPGRVSSLPAQPVEKAYSAMDGIWLEIPDLGLTLPITGVPIGPDGWDLTWLTNQAGYLQGTTLPGDVGTTGLTAHITLADGTPGPFRNLNRLYWGNKIILHADGYRYVYEVRESRTVLPRDLSVLKKDGYTWLTLITCEGYVPWLDSYNYRLAVRAVLLSVEPDTVTSPFASDSPPQQPPTMWDWINRYGP